jgi:predicted sulfurtransferase
MRKLATFVVTALLGTVCAVAQVPGPAPLVPTTTQPANELDSARRIDQKEAIELVKKHKAVFVDVRGKEAYEQGHIKGAMSSPLAEIITRLKEVPPGKMIITYCA